MDLEENQNVVIMETVQSIEQTDDADVESSRKRPRVEQDLPRTPDRLGPLKSEDFAPPA